MSFAVDDYRALVQLLLDHPEWRAELRPLILGEEMAGLPGAVERLSATVQELASSVAALRQSVERLDSRLDALRNDFNSRVGRLEGNDLETRYFHHVGGWFGKWLKKPHAVSPEDLDLDDAVDAGRISEDELEAVRSLDIIVRGLSKGATPGEDALLAAEISLTIDTPDVHRAAERAAILRRAGFEVRGFVGGEVLTAHAAEAAKEAGVIVDLRTGH